MTKSSASVTKKEAGEERLIREVAGKKVLFIATTYLDYLRIQQELKLIKLHAKQVDVIVSKNKTYLLRLFTVYFKLLFKSIKRYDVVFLGFAPQLVQCIWWWKFRKNKVIIDFFISFHDTLVHDRKKFKDQGFVSNRLLWLDKFTLRKADLIIADTAHHAEYFIQDLNANRSKTTVLYLEADSTYYFPQNVPKHEKYRNDFVVFYFATVLPLQGVDVVIDAITQISDAQIYFVFVGPLSQSQKDKLHLQEKLTYYPWLEQVNLAELIAQADLCLAGHFNDSIKKAKRTIPGKAYIFEAMEKKMLLGENEANKERYPQQYKNVKFVEMGSSQTLKEAILSVAGAQNDNKS
ncbi:glycosyltransferase [Marinicella rhabdoformis]|uniref:glycosyltransferase n=1 Tax=Marinicella rhabdoformis TaxID=2580566 RepID=UPI0012AEC3AD|nr:glycosyltransferase [Marinicella rhabdoformis]